MARRIHDLNTGRDSKPTYFIFEGHNILWMMLGAGLSLLIFRQMTTFGWSFGESILLAVIPTLLSFAYVVLMKQGKPPSYDLELFEWLGFRFRMTLDRWGIAKAGSYSRVEPGKKKHPLAQEDETR